MSEGPETIGAWWRVTIILALVGAAVAFGARRADHGARISALEAWRALVESRAEKYDERLRQQEAK